MDPRDGGEGWSDNRRNLLELGKCLGGGLTPEETCEVLELLLVAPLAGTRLPHDCLPYWVQAAGFDATVDLGVGGASP